MIAQPGSLLVVEDDDDVREFLAGDLRARGFRTETSGKPHVQIQGTAWEICQQRGIASFQLSISHCRSHATAFAVALGNGEEAS